MVQEKETLMKGKQIAVLVLAGILLLLIAGYLILSGQEIGESQSTETEEIVSVIPAQEITSFTLEFEGDIMTFQRSEEGSWVCMEDDTLKADEGILSGMVQSLSSITAFRTITDLSHLSDYGLDQPTAKISAQGSKEDYTLEIGSYQKSVDGYYAMISGEDCVYLINTSLAESFFYNRETIQGVIDPE